VEIQRMIAEARLGDSFPLPATEPFTLAQARASGISRRDLRRLAYEGLIRRPIQSVYVATELGDALMLRAKCLRLVVPPDAVIVDRHAGWLHGANMMLRPNEHLALRPVSMFLPAGRGRLRNTLADSGERTFLPEDLMQVGGLRVTTPIRTAWDLGRVRWADDAISALDAMFRLELFSHEEFLDGFLRFRGMRWVTTLRAMGPLADGRSESPGESVLRLRCIENGLSTMVCQVEVWRDGLLIARLDLADEDLQLAVEYDGAEWHSSPTQQAHDRTRREAAGEEGWLVKPFRKEHVFGRGRECDAMLAEAAREARARRGLKVVW
jgi:hypothetical protein